LSWAPFLYPHMCSRRWIYPRNLPSPAGAPPPFCPAVEPHLFPFARPTYNPKNRALYSAMGMLVMGHARLASEATASMFCSLPFLFANRLVSTPTCTAFYSPCLRFPLPASSLGCDSLYDEPTVWPPSFPSRASCPMPLSTSVYQHFAVMVNGVAFLFCLYTPPKSPDQCKKLPGRFAGRSSEGFRFPFCFIVLFFLHIGDRVFRFFPTNPTLCFFFPRVSSRFGRSACEPNTL